MTYGWSRQVRKRANADHKRRKEVKVQKKHLYLIKSDKQLREMRAASRRKQK